MVLLETWCAWLSSVPTCIVVTMFIISALRALCATKEAEKSNYAQTDMLNDNKGAKRFSHVGIVCLCAFWVRSFIQALVFTILIAEDRHQERIGTTLGISWFFYGSGLWLMLLSFVLRIQYTFKGTHLEYSPVVIKILYVLLSVLLIEIIVIVILDTIIPSLSDIAVYIGYAALVSHFTFSCLLSGLLFTKIFNTMQYRLRERSGSHVPANAGGLHSDEDETGGVASAGGSAADIHVGVEQETTTMKESQEDDREQDMEHVGQANIDQISLTSIDAVTRYALLMFVGIVSTYIVSILVLVDIAEGWSVSYHILTWGATLVGFDLLVNATAVYLLFEYNSSTYHRVCKFCHVGCERWCVECIYLYSQRSKNGRSVQNKNRQEFATLILAADDDGAVI